MPSSLPLLPWDAEAPGLLRPSPHPGQHGTWPCQVAVVEGSDSDCPPWRRAGPDP